jgi:signal transduction histidine kinase
MTSSQSQDQVLILAPFGRDAALIHTILKGADIRSEICPSMAALETAIPEGSGTALIADEVLRPETVESLTGNLRRQPPWSDFPLLIMTSGGDETAGSRRRLRLTEPLGNVTLLERPLRKATLISSVQAALRARRRQYEIRDYMAQRERDEKDLRRANAELEQFAYSASHDLQEPLRMVAIYSQMLRKKYSNCLDAKAEEYIRYLSEGATHMQQLVRDLLLYTQSTMQDEEGGTIDANGALDRALANLRVPLKQTQAVITRYTLPEIQMHEASLQQIFQNLIGNALKYRQTDVPRIEIRAQRSGSSWVFSVSDNGIGIDKQYAEYVFGLFKRLHAGPEYAGTGIGLAICKKIVDRYGGRIWVESELGKGSTFLFSIPDRPAGTTLQ